MCPGSIKKSSGQLMWFWYNILKYFRVVKEGFLTGLFNDLKKDEDILVQLNAIEILSNMAETKHGFQYLTSLNILSQMDLRLNEVSSGPMSHFLMPGYIKFFGRLAHQTPKNFHNLYPNFTSILLNMLSNTSDQDQVISRDLFVAKNIYSIFNLYPPILQ